MVHSNLEFIARINSCLKINCDASLELSVEHWKMEQLMELYYM